MVSTKPDVAPVIKMRKLKSVSRYATDYPDNLVAY